MSHLQITFKCSQCGRTLTAPVSAAGSVGTCECGATNTVPTVTPTEQGKALGATAAGPSPSWATPTVKTPVERPAVPAPSQPAPLQSAAAPPASGSAPPATHLPSTAGTACPACGGAIRSAKAHWLPGFLVGVGCALLTPSIGLMVLAVLVGVLGSAGLIGLALPDAAVSGFVASESWSLALAIGGPAVLPLAIGVGLVLRKRVWRCTACGALVHRA